MGGLRRILAVTLAIVCLFLFSSLSLASEPKQGGTLRIAVRMPQYHRLDPRNNTLETMAPASGMIYDCLFNWGPDGYKNMVPQLATSYETKDNKVWIIHLRKGVKFHNGREMTAEDVKTNLDWRFNLPKGWRPIKYKEFIKYFQSVDVVDKYTVKITLGQPFSPLMRILTYALRGIVPPEEVEKWGKKFTSHPCGTGPFKLGEVKPKAKVVLERFDDYWGPKPYVDRVEYKYYRSDDARLIALQKGEVDIAYLYDEAKPLLEKDPNLDYEAVINTFSMRKIYFNFRRWPMNDIRFRKAIWMGADWKNISINAFAYKSGNPTRSLLDFTKFYNPEAAGLVPPYNPEEAKKLIQAVEKDAGKKIPPIYLLDTNRTLSKNVAEPAKLQLAQIGVPLDLHLLSTGIWIDKILRDPKIEWDLGSIGIGFASNPSTGFRYFETDSGVAPDGKSLGGYSNPEFDKLIQKSEAAQTEEEVIKYYHEAEKILLKDVAVVPWFPNRQVFGYNKKVKGLKFLDTAGVYVTNTWTNVWLEE